MKRKIFAAMAVMCTAVLLSACGFGSKDDKEQVVIVEETPTPEPTQEPLPTPTIGPDIQDTTYTSADRTVSFELPDATWGSKQDSDGLIIVESPEEGKLYITHRAGENMTIIPDTADMALTLETGAGLVADEDFQLVGYTRENVNGVEVTAYQVKYLNTEKSEGVTTRIWKFFVNAQQNECYEIEAQILKEEEDLIARVQASVDSFKVLGESSLAPAFATEAPVDPAAAAAGGADAAQVNGGFTEEQLNDTNQTRVIYDNRTGTPIVVTPGDGVWLDNAGNSYRFADDGSTVYDQNDVDYYYHGESAIVYYMSAE